MEELRLLVYGVPEHNIVFEGVALPVGVGFTVMLNCMGVPVTSGTTLITAVIAIVLVLIATNAGKPPVPLAASPIEAPVELQS